MHENSIYINQEAEKLIQKILGEFKGFFKPTNVYVKRHSKTGLLYFGKTCKENPIKYKGSGIHWVRHFKKHGQEFIETIFLKHFTSLEECVRYTIMFSYENDIVNSKIWANAVIENGIGGGIKGIIVTEEHRQNLRKGAKNKPPDTEETKKRKSISKRGVKNPNYNKIYTTEERRKLSDRVKGNKYMLGKGRIVQQINPINNKVIMEGTINIFIDMGFERKHINAVCNNKKHYLTHKKFKWRYKLENE